MEQCHRVRWAILPGLAHKRLIRALQTYLHCKGLPLNTSQGLINALFKSCAPITNWLESSASSITQKRPLQIKIPMIYTWKALKGISSQLISHKCFKHPNFYSWFEKKSWGPVRLLCAWVGLGSSSEFEMCTTDRETYIPPTGNQYKWGKNIAWSNPSVKYDKFIGGWFYFTNTGNDCNLLCILSPFSLNAKGPITH